MKIKVTTDELHIARLALQTCVVLMSIDLLRESLSKTATAQDSNITSLSIRQGVLKSAFKHSGGDPEPELTDAKNYRNAINEIGETAAQAIDAAAEKLDEVVAS